MAGGREKGGEEEGEKCKWRRLNGGGRGGREAWQEEG